MEAVYHRQLSSAVADSLLKWLSKQGVYSQGYADDGVVLIIGKIMSTLCDIAQRILCITGAVHTTPTIALQMIISLSPLDIHIKQEAMLSCFWLQVNSQWVSSACSHTSIKNTAYSFSISQT